MLNRRRLLKLSVLSAASALGWSAVCSRVRTEVSSSEMPDYSSTGVTLLQQTTPLEDGFFFPAEWEPHEFTIMVFPPAQNWKGYGLKKARREWAAVANAVNEFEPVVMVVHPQDKGVAKGFLSSDIELIEFPVNDGWARDSGPMFLVNGKGSRRVAGFTFNGWGGKFPPYHDDALLKARLSNYFETTMYSSSLVLEGGGVTLDGEGTIITTEECLLNPNRNPRMSKSQVERLLKDYLGAETVVWLGRGIVPDPVTDGHVDGICAFAAPGLVLLHSTDDRNDPNYKICRDAKHRLQKSTDARGRKFEIVEIPLGLDIAHMNFYIANNAVIVPVAGDSSQDDAPLAILREVFPGRRVVGVDSLILAEGGGGIHCITQQVPVANGVSRQ
ncbi:agmatine deiminase family protein [Moorena sp. SIO3H5]|uniref:agmatine deiminase family protein n=1 Tax=Moorena sp. SIO3H5 TaxID=2607834 RepID=UPI0025D46AEF|nr:agmatine deiminase family protein [Moorena sp. SIO3H5]